MPARWDAKAMEALKEGHDTSKMHGPQRIDIMSKISDAIADECSANDMSVIEPALALLDTRGVHALSGPTLYMEYWDSEENLDDTVIETGYFEYSGEPRCNQLSAITRFQKVLCALLNATTRVCQPVPTWYFTCAIAIYIEDHLPVYLLVLFGEHEEYSIVVSCLLRYISFHRHPRLSSWQVIRLSS
nr:unnamed protein product [Haemonchus contortus]